MLSRVALRGAVCVRARCTNASLQMPARPQPRQPLRVLQRQPMRFTRAFASEGKLAIDEKIEEIQEQYATAKDEVSIDRKQSYAQMLTSQKFEIAMEETESNTVYAQDDRDAAREEFDKLKDMFNTAIADADHGEEIQRRIGQRIRELESAVENMEELAQNQD